MGIELKINKILIIIFSFFLFNNIYSQEIIDLVETKKPYYNWATSLSIGYFYPIGFYKDIIEPAPFINFDLYYNPKIINNFLIGLEVGYAFSNFKNNSNKTYKLIPYGLSLNYLIPFFNNFNLSLNVSCGQYLFVLPNKTYENIYFKGGLSLDFIMTNNLELSITSQYYLLADEVKYIHGINTGVAFKYIFGTLLNEKDIKIISMQTDKVFASLYSNYYHKPIGVLNIKNTTKSTIKDIHVSIYIKKYMDDKTRSKYIKKNLKKNESTHIPFYALFNSKILEIENDVNTTGILEIEYVKANGKKFKKRDLFHIKIYGRNAIIWDDVKKIGSFITTKDTSVINFSRKILSINTQSKKYNLNEDFVNAIKVIEALNNYRIKYVKDPKTPYEVFSGQAISVDYIQYPIETLIRKTGDCDDLVVLISSLLETIGIDTALISVPGHIFMLIEAKDFAFSNKIIQFQNKKWIPLETTLINEGFTAAWLKGYQNFVSYKVKEIIPISEAISKYNPVSFLTQNVKNIELDEEKYKENYHQQLKLINDLIKGKEISITELNKLPIKQLNKKGVAYCKTSDFKRCEEIFLMVLKKNKYYKFAMYNLLVLYRLQKKYEKAILLFKKMIKKNPFDSKAYYLISKVYYDLKNYKLAEKFYNKAVSLDPTLEDVNFSLNVKKQYISKANQFIYKVKWFE